MLAIKKEIETGHGLFRIGSVVLNEKEVSEDDSNTIKPVCSGHDFMLHFKPKGSIGVHVGKRHFSSLEEAEAYVRLLDINGFSRTDL